MNLVLKRSMECKARYMRVTLDIRQNNISEFKILLELYIYLLYTEKIKTDCLQKTENHTGTTPPHH